MKLSKIRSRGVFQLILDSKTFFQPRVTSYGQLTALIPPEASQPLSRTKMCIVTIPKSYGNHICSSVEYRSVLTGQTKRGAARKTLQRKTLKRDPFFPTTHSWEAGRNPHTSMIFFALQTNNKARVSTYVLRKSTFFHRKGDI